MTLHFECNGTVIASYQTTWEVNYGDVTMIEGIQYRVIGYKEVENTVLLMEEERPTSVSGVY